MVIERPKTGLSGRRQGQHRALNGLQQRAEAEGRDFYDQGTAKGRPEKRLYGPLVKSAGFDALNLSWNPKKRRTFNGWRELDAPHHSPLASEGRDSPSVVRDAGGGALRFLDCTPD